MHYLLVTVGVVFLLVILNMDFYLFWLKNIRFYLFIPYMHELLPQAYFQTLFWHLYLVPLQ